jgi:hypothetical protein
MGGGANGIRRRRWRRRNGRRDMTKMVTKTARRQRQR